MSMDACDASLQSAQRANEAILSDTRNGRGSIPYARVQLAPSHHPHEWLSHGPRTTVEVVERDGRACVRTCPPGRPPILYMDNTPRVAYVDGLTYHPSGRDLPMEPTVLTGCTAGWRAMEQEDCWALHNLVKRCSPDALFAVDGGPGFARESLAGGQVTLAAYDQYAREVEQQQQQQGREGERHEPAPLYIFDPLLATRTFADGSPLRDEFRVPLCFRQDTQAGCRKGRPLPPCWLLVGVAGSGTPIHDHPTTVSNHTLLCGLKLWVCLPPSVHPSYLLLGEANTYTEDMDLSALDWLAVWGGCDAAEGAEVTVGEQQPQQAQEEEEEEEACSDAQPASTRLLPPSAHVIVQQPGETVFAPAGWWHVVLNVRTSTAISHSLSLRRDFERVWPGLKACEGEEDTFADQWAAHVARLDAGEAQYEEDGRVDASRWGTV